jgi:AMP deaminase
MHNPDSASPRSRFESLSPRSRASESNSPLNYSPINSVVSAFPKSTLNLDVFDDKIDLDFAAPLSAKRHPNRGRQNSLEIKDTSVPMCLDDAPTGPRNPLIRNASQSALRMLSPKRQKSTRDHTESLDPEFSRILITGDYMKTAENAAAAQKFRRALEYRRQFVWRAEQKAQPPVDLYQKQEYRPPVLDNPPLTATRHGFICRNGVYMAWEGDSEQEAKVFFRVASRTEFAQAYAFIREVSQDPPCRTFAFGRLKILDARFDLHSRVNYLAEVWAQKAVPHRDFYNVRKIDNHVHHSACMNQKHMLRFMKHKLRHAQNDVVKLDEKKQPVTLQQVFDQLELTAYDLSVDSLDVRSSDTFQRFDKFNLKYNPIGVQDLRTIFLKSDNYMEGRYLAEITLQVLGDLASNKYQLAEYRLSIYGRKRTEWSVLAKWVMNNNLCHESVRWMIQIPRIYNVWRQSNAVKSFQDMLDNIFQPLFEVTIDPSIDPQMHLFLQALVAFDSVDDESQPEVLFNDDMPAPSEWTNEQNPPYAYVSYYLYANLVVLNKLRQSKGLNTFTYRPHAGEAGDISHLACTYLLAHGINHGILLEYSPPLQYLYYLCQIGISMSPLSNNLIFLKYEKSPFPALFRRGLNVTLSTDDPLMIHVTKEPLVEEYSVAAQVWKLTSVDMCEVARNSVLQSGWEHRFKARWLGNNYFLRTTAGNDIRQSNIPNIRIQFRWESLSGEFQLLSDLTVPRITDISCDEFSNNTQIALDPSLYWL